MPKINLTPNSWHYHTIYIYINDAMPQAGIDPPEQSHASYEASALPPRLDLIQSLEETFSWDSGSKLAHYKLGMRLMWNFTKSDNLKPKGEINSKFIVTSSSWQSKYKIRSYQNSLQAQIKQLKIFPQNSHIWLFVQGQDSPFYNYAILVFHWLFPSEKLY